jgi:hypothetical protein
MFGSRVLFVASIWISGRERRNTTGFWKDSLRILGKDRGVRARIVGGDGSQTVSPEPMAGPDGLRSATPVGAQQRIGVAT